MSGRGELRERLRRASARADAPWVAGAALAIGAVAAWLVVRILPAEGADVAAARELGIVSQTILAGHSKSAETRAYGLGLAAALFSSVGLFAGWAAFAGRGEAPARQARKPARRAVGAVEAALVLMLLVALFARIGTARTSFANPWVVLSEEGEMLAWVDTVLRGGMLSRDVFCLYGPFSIWPVALLSEAFGPSLALWRTWIFALAPPALLALYLLLRSLVATRAAALAATLAIGLLHAAGIPAMSWSPARVGLGLGAFACLCRGWRGGEARWFAGAGALLGVALLFSQEVGIACAAGAGVALLTRPGRLRALAWTAAGGAAVVAPWAAFIAAHGALGATLDNLFLFPRTRVLGFGAYAFPELAPSAESLRAYVFPALLGVAGFAVATRVLRGERGEREAAEIGLFVFGALLFLSALSRPDSTHFIFAAPPALVLLAGLMEDAWFALAARDAPRPRRAAAAVGLALGAAALLPWAPTLAGNAGGLFGPDAHGFRELALPRGGGASLPGAFASEVEEVVRALQSRTAPDEPIWVYPNEALLYFLADRPQATAFPLALFAVTRAQRLDLVAQLERSRPRYAVGYHDAAVIDGIPYFMALPEVLAYLDLRYEPEARLGAFTVLRRRG